MTGKGIDDDYVASDGDETSVWSGISKEDICIIEDIHNLKREQRKRLMKYIEALKQIEALEELSDDV